MSTVSRPTGTGLGLRVMMFNATFNNISVISWRSVLLEEETRVPGENRRPATSCWQTLSHIMLYRRVHLVCGIRTHYVSVDSIGSYKSNYRTNTTTTTPTGTETSNLIYITGACNMNLPPSSSFSYLLFICIFIKFLYHLISFLCASWCTWLLQGVKISISTDRNVDNVFIPG